MKKNPVPWDYYKNEIAENYVKNRENQKHWKEENTVPKRVVVHFVNEIQEKDIKQLLQDIKMTEGWEKVFFEKDAKSSITGNHQKGHV